MKNYNLYKLLIALIIPLIVGGVSAALSASGMSLYAAMDKPPLSPPGWVFSVAWTILYILMGLASYYIFINEENNQLRVIAIVMYAIQLAINFMWSLIFFRWDAYLAAFICLVVLWCVVILTAYRFYVIDKKAGLLMIPYILWLTFAGYLNMGAFMLSTGCL